MNSEKQREYNRRYYQQHKEKLQAKHNRYRQDHREAALEYSRQYYTNMTDDQRRLINEQSQKRERNKRQQWLAEFVGPPKPTNKMLAELAKERGDRHFHGLPCRTCGCYKRYTSTKYCFDCQSRNSSKWQHNNLDKVYAARARNKA